MPKDTAPEIAVAIPTKPGYTFSRIVNDRNGLGMFLVYKKDKEKKEPVNTFMENISNKIPQFPGYIFDRVGTPDNHDFILNYKGELIQVGMGDRYDCNYVIYKPDYSTLVTKFTKTYPMSDIYKFEDLCEYCIIIYNDGSVGMSTMEYVLKSYNYPTESRKEFIPFTIPKDLK